mmetsp:Transcript_2049/g.4177  ORF Transcript_2049/g.4177 Transcript_2049/m.4177 type:complete len:385 (+) Transcript_2049:436-1590(+)
MERKHHILVSNHVGHIGARENNHCLAIYHGYAGLSNVVRRLWGDGVPALGSDFVRLHRPRLLAQMPATRGAGGDANHNLRVHHAAAPAQSGEPSPRGLPSQLDARIRESPVQPKLVGGDGAHALKAVLRKGGRCAGWLGGNQNGGAENAAAREGAVGGEAVDVHAAPVVLELVRLVEVRVAGLDTVGAARLEGPLVVEALERAGEGAVPVPALERLSRGGTGLQVRLVMHLPHRVYHVVRPVLLNAVVAVHVSGAEPLAELHEGNAVRLVAHGVQDVVAAAPVLVRARGGAARGERIHNLEVVVARKHQRNVLVDHHVQTHAWVKDARAARAFPMLRCRFHNNVGPWARLPLALPLALRLRLCFALRLGLGRGVVLQQRPQPAD